MNEITQALLRTTLGVVVSALFAQMLLAKFPRTPPWIQQLILAAVLLQGWAIFPLLTIGIPESRPEDSAQAAIPVEGPLPLIEIAEATTATQQQPVKVSLNSSMEPSSIVLILWISGAALIALLWGGRYLKLVRCIPLGRAAEEEEWREELRFVEDEARVSGKAYLRVTEKAGPFTCWIPWAYLILVPEFLWSKFSRQQRVAVLRHETAHIARGDLWLSVFIRLLALPQWFNPLAFSLIRRFDEAAEWACDDRVIRQTESRDNTLYAEILVQIAELNLADQSCTLGIQGGALSHRIRRLLHSPVKEKTVLRNALFSVLASLSLAQFITIQATLAEIPQNKVDERTLEKPPSQASLAPNDANAPENQLSESSAATLREPPKQTSQPQAQASKTTTTLSEQYPSIGHPEINGKNATFFLGASAEGETFLGSIQAFQKLRRRNSETSLSERMLARIASKGAYRISIQLVAADGRVLSYAPGIRNRTTLALAAADDEPEEPEYQLLAQLLGGGADVREEVCKGKRKPLADEKGKLLVQFDVSQRVESTGGIPNENKLTGKVTWTSKNVRLSEIITIGQLTEVNLESIRDRNNEPASLRVLVERFAFQAPQESWKTINGWPVPIEYIYTGGLLPGMQLEYTRGMRINEAIALAGGLEASAESYRLCVIRQGRQLELSSGRSDFLLAGGDTVIAKKLLE